MSSLPLIISLVVLILVSTIIALVQPRQFFTEDGQLKEFSVAHLLHNSPMRSKYTWRSLPVFLILLTFMTYLLVFLTTELIKIRISPEHF